jgi:hypothetical protein
VQAEVNGWPFPDAAEAVVDADEIGLARVARRCSAVESTSGAAETRLAGALAMSSLPSRGSPAAQHAIRRPGRGLFGGAARLLRFVVALRQLATGGRDLGAAAHAATRSARAVEAPVPGPAVGEVDAVDCQAFAAAPCRRLGRQGSCFGLGDPKVRSRSSSR